jgi:hypothetical protein
LIPIVRHKGARESNVEAEGLCSGACCSCLTAGLECFAWLVFLPCRRMHANTVPMQKLLCCVQIVSCTWQMEWSAFEINHISTSCMQVATICILSIHQSREVWRRWMEKSSHAFFLNQICVLSFSASMSGGGIRPAPHRSQTCVVDKNRMTL